MKKKIIPLLAALGIGCGANADTMSVTDMKYAGPYMVKAPLMIDSVDVNNKAFNTSSLLSTPLSLDLLKEGSQFNGPIIERADGTALHLLGFTVDNDRYVKGTLNVEGLKNYEVYVDGKRLDGSELSLLPATHSIAIKCLTDTAATDSIKVGIETSTPDALKLNRQGGRRITLKDIMTGRRFSSAALSPSGKYLQRVYYFTHEGGTHTFNYVVTDLATGRTMGTGTELVRWMPKSELLYLCRYVNGKPQLVTIDPATWAENVIAENLPDSQFFFSPTEDYLIYMKYEDGPAEKNSDVYEIIHPDDRQPGWRNRGSIMKYDLATGMTQQLTFGHSSTSACGITDDGTKMLIMTSDSKPGKRPTTRSSLYLLDLATLKTDTLVKNDGFLGGAMISPDGTKAAILGSPEALEGIGRNLPDSLIPSMYDNQLFVMDVASKNVTPLTRTFDPSVENFEWSRTDGKIYFSAENRDKRTAHRVDPITGRIEDLPLTEEIVSSFSLAAKAPSMVYVGQGATNSDRLYTVNTKNLKEKLVEDLSANRLDGITIGSCEGWSFLSSRRDTITGRFILPPDFDPTKKYPMIVNYYGGCSPTSRNFESRYPHHVYAAHGYVVLVLNPSGATGFGQEFAARHVNTAGEGVAQDIIEGVKKFTEEHSYVDAAKIGCIGASYGGFMTQYLQTKTDIFAAAISHAGISDHTSYWGEGYWGYSYSEVSMADSYPWTRTDLYVERSPLYNADKIHTPLLFLHGDADTNVPFGESIQMYNALKLLGRETAFVAVKGENHQIMDYYKRQQWQNTIFAWFAKYLQDDPTWWQEMYPEKALTR
ncbi:prolyl oligopeptidase family serine peptidase [uncultured Duncaniella sp.]|uniref:S9 family peptidase n=1 Tax=uncultured Duncaniella sp. TaxID=2768039 RepID=UPI002607B897|nr:prolyl oligopeptidase family serine peptidase [uncultured Duncaniella sp.]